MLFGSQAVPHGGDFVGKISLGSVWFAFSTNSF